MKRILIFYAILLMCVLSSCIRRYDGVVLSNVSVIYPTEDPTDFKMYADCTDPDTKLKWRHVMVVTEQSQKTYFVSLMDKKLVLVGSLFIDAPNYVAFVHFKKK